MTMAKTVCNKIEINVAGTTFEGRQGKLWNLRKHDEGAYVMLRREKNNTHDANAIAVIAVTGTTHAKIGYVPADIALWLAPKMDNNLLVRAYRPASGKFVTGGNNKNMKLGCTIAIIFDVTKVETLAKAPAMALVED